MSNPSDKPNFFDGAGDFNLPPAKSEPEESKPASEVSFEDFLKPIEAKPVEEAPVDFGALFGGAQEPVEELVVESAEMPWQSAEQETDMNNIFDQQDYGQVEDIEEPAPELQIPKGVYKAYADYDYGDDSLAQEIEAEQAAKKGIKVDRQTVIILAVILLVGAYFGYQALNPDYSKQTHSKRKRSPRRVPNKAAEILGVDLSPLWDLTRQKGIPANYDRDMIDIALMNAGKDNPFTIPGQVIEVIKDAVEQQIEEVKPPEMYKRRAYRAGLVGVLTSGDRNLALVSYKEADFEYLQGTKKVKIVKLATKSMSKAKEEFLELLEQDYIGPWQIIKIEAGKTIGKEAFITIKFEKELRTMKVGQALELGIFDMNDQLDVFRDADDGLDDDVLVSDD